ncbi:Zinc finger BED domain-containing protein 1 [Anabarilius grahami]|uniref:Zinc finger BED domain-containing protein 1 n=1 Tax=Anabarilius grahami TaxID=495550 RepID=A0A3N0YQ94_ANAGA|nr:Zinc finger BED domain-containing protein 1 [Anabarilius grahami]
MSLSHMDPALRQRTYSDLTTEIVSSLGTEDCDEGQAAEPTGANLDTSPPQKKSAIAELFGETFASKDMDSKTPADIIKEEVASYLAASGITVDGDPLTWWKSNECKYPHIAKMARCYLAVPGSSVPSERVFSTAGDIVTAKRSTLSLDNVDILVFLKKIFEIISSESPAVAAAAQQRRLDHRLSLESPGRTIQQKSAHKGGNSAGLRRAWKSMKESFHTQEETQVFAFVPEDPSQELPHTSGVDPSGTDPLESEPTDGESPDITTLIHVYVSLMLLGSVFIFPRLLLVPHLICTGVFRVHSHAVY